MSIREDLAAALREHSGNNESEETIDETPEVVAAADELADDGGRDVESPRQGEPAERVRDPETGKFQKRKEVTPEEVSSVKAKPPTVVKKGTVDPAAPAKPDPKAPAAQDPAAVAQPAAPAETVKAPQSWKATAREKWAAVPPEIQAEVMRREKEFATQLEGVAEDRKLSHQLRQVLAPYEGMIRAEGSHPLQAVGNLLQTAAALRTAPVAHKAKLVAGLMDTFGIPVEALASALDGKAPAKEHQSAPPINPDTIVEKVLQGLQQRAQQTELADARTQLTKFLENPPEFFEDVKLDMADILDTAHRRGVKMTYQQAYERACKLDPEISGILDQREKAKAATTPAPSIQRSKAAATSVRNQPAPAVNPNKKGSLKDDLEEAFAEVNGR